MIINKMIDSPVFPEVEFGLEFSLPQGLSRQRMTLLKEDKLNIKIGHTFEALQINIIDQSTAMFNEDFYQLFDLIDQISLHFRKLNFLRLIISGTLADDIPYFIQMYRPRLLSLNRLSSLKNLEIQFDVNEGNIKKYFQGAELNTEIKFVCIKPRAKVFLKNDKCVLPEQVKQEMQEKFLNSSYTSLMSEKILQHTSKIEEWKCFILEKPSIKMSQQLRIMDHIKEINFSQLKVLRLHQSQIQSIEALARMRAPLLEKIKINDNFIHSSRPLIKLHSIYLRQISIEDNCIQEFQSLSGCFWRKIQKLRIAFKTVQGQTVSFLAKMEGNEQQKAVRRGAKNRITTTILENKIKQKQYKMAN